MILRHCEIVCDVDKLKVDLQATLMKYKTIKKWAYIIHDKDDTRPHYHIYLNFGVGVDTKKVAEWFEIPDNFVGKVKGRASDMLLYLTHGNDSQKNKYQYDDSEVVANFDFKQTIEEASIIGNFKDYSYAQQLEYVNTLPIADKTRVFTQLKKLWELECICQNMNTDRDIRIVFITGKGGTGKTYYAKKLCDIEKLDYCVSSSSNDPFQDYLGQRVMIFDDLRDTAFEFEDLLKILDNHTNSSIKSRFSNKCFNGVMIIITSSIPLIYWYKSKKLRKTNDSLVQLYRRINSYVEITNEEIKIYDNGLDEEGRPFGEPCILKNELISKKRQSDNKLNLSESFKNIINIGID